MRFGPTVLIAFGIIFLLYNLNIIAFTPWALIWPGFLIWLGASQLIEIARGQQDSDDSWELVLWLIVLASGIYLLLPKIGLHVPSLPWKVIWPGLLILLGVSKLIYGKPEFIKFGTTNSSGETIVVNHRTSFIGEFNRGPESWILDNLNIRQGIGSVNLDLTQAIIPDKEVTIEVTGFIGEANIYLPPGLPYKADCRLSVGEIVVLGHNESGTHRYVNVQSPDYDDAVQKVTIYVRWNIGAVNIRQIG